jgi:hypothetical protein
MRWSHLKNVGKFVISLNGWMDGYEKKEHYYCYAHHEEYYEVPKEGDATN